jgi:hypothetical protein
MGIEPTRKAVPDLENKRFGTMVNATCDGRVNFRGMWGHVGLRRDTSLGEVGGVAGSSLPVVGLRTAMTGPSAVHYVRLVAASRFAADTNAVVVGPAHSSSLSVSTRDTLSPYGNSPPNPTPVADARPAGGDEPRRRVPVPDSA